MDEQLRSDAVAWLLQRGLAIDTDFTVENAVSIANDIAGEDAAEQATLQLAGRYIGFVGNGNCENCRGWNGMDRRCDCGNRRVCWATGYGHTFKNPQIHAEAW